MPSPTQPATGYLEQARQLITSIAETVAPHSAMHAPLGDSGPMDCSAPLRGLQYYSIDREFDAPAGKTGADLLPAIATELHKYGYQTMNSEVAGQAGLRAATTLADMVVTGSYTSPLVHFGIETQCGTPAQDPGT